MGAYLLAIGLCFGALEERTGLPSWQLEYFSKGRELVQACRDEPVNTLHRVRGGRIFDPALGPAPARQGAREPETDVTMR